MSQRTLVLVKPDGVARGLVGEVLSRIERKGFRIVAMELRTIPVGWVLQALVVLTGLLAPAMFIVGGIFALLGGVATTGAAARLSSAAAGAGGPVVPAADRS